MSASLFRVIDSAARVEHNHAVASRSALDSSNRLIRAIERWKRGTTALIIIAMMAGGTLVAIALPCYLIAQVTGWGDWEGATAFLFLLTAPWTIGERAFLLHIGSIASVSDE